MNFFEGILNLQALFPIITGSPGLNTAGKYCLNNGYNSQYATFFNIL